MKIRDWLELHSRLEACGFREQAGQILIKGLYDLENERVYTVDLATARKWNLTTPHNIREHLEAKIRPYLTRRSCAGRMYSLSSRQKSWLRAQLNAGTALPDAVRILYFTARVDDPTVVDQCAVEFQYFETTPRGSVLAVKALFTWAEMLDYDSGELRVKGKSGATSASERTSSIGSGSRTSSSDENQGPVKQENLRNETLKKLFADLGLGLE